MYKILVKLYNRFIEDEVPALSAQLSYSLIFAFFPFLIFLLTLAGYTPLTSEGVLNDLALILPESTYDLVIEIARDIVKKRSGTLLSFSMLGTLWASSNGLSALLRAFNRAYNHRESRPFFLVKALTLVYTIGLALVILIIFSFIIFGEIIGRYLFEAAGYSDYFIKIWDIARYVISLFSILMVIFLLYYILPNKKMKFSEIVPGSIFATVAWISISLGFSFYVNNFTSYSTTYGSIGGVIVLLLWLYWSSVILIMGAELNAVLASS
ncbi:MAG TPA: YihY/virulence factor BrkB family protein [Clostridiaceae bacterium]|nr:YihY/virulence factor BrkB family protein [Clostridiaceae bacterium]